MYRCLKISPAMMWRLFLPIPWPKPAGSTVHRCARIWPTSGEFGIRGVGYHVTSLIAAITSALGVDCEWRMALIGVGNLGKAILNHDEFRTRGFNIVGIFDCDPFKIGEIVHGLEVHCTKDLKGMVADLGIEIGIITTPPERAQRAAQHLMDAGLTSILNFTTARIKVPERVHVEYVDFFHHLYALAFNHTQARY